MLKEVPFYKPSIDKQEVSLVNEVLEFGKTDKVVQFEKEMTKYIGSKNAISTNNNTAAMHLALCAIDHKRGDKIVCSVNSFPSVAEVVRHFDAEPIFVDIDRDDFNMDPKHLEQVLSKHHSKKLKAIFVTHMAGQPANMKEIYELADAYSVKIIDDASMALGSTYDGKKIGTLKSAISCFGFGLQIRQSIASAGAIITDDEEISQRAKLLRNHAIVSDTSDRFDNLGYIYDVVDIGLKYTLDELSAAYAIGKLNKNDVFIKRRIQIAKMYDEQLANCPHVTIPVKKREHTYSQYIIKIDKNRDNFAKELRERGVYTALHFIPLHLLSYYRGKYNLKVNDFPNALNNYQQILSLPIYSSMSDAEVMYVCDKIKEVAKARG